MNNNDTLQYGQQAGREPLMKNVGSRSTSFVGVCFDNTKKKFKAYVDVFGVRVRLGSAFTSESDAAAAVNAYKTSVFDTPYPLLSFLSSYFGLEKDTALAFIADSVQLYPRVSSAMKFPNFTVSRLKAYLAAGSSPTTVTNPTKAQDVLLSAPQPAKDIIFGRKTFRSIRAENFSDKELAERGGVSSTPCRRYESIIAQFIQISNDLLR